MIRKLQNKILKILFALSLSSLISCAVVPPDVPLCTELSPTRGYCINTISSTEFEISETKKYKEKSWWEIRPYMIFMPQESWAEIKKFIIKICKKSRKCSGDDVGSWNRTINIIDKKMVK